jgi:hypothetical protein
MDTSQLDIAEVNRMAKSGIVVPNAVAGYSKKSAKEEKARLQDEEKQKDKLNKLVDKLRENARRGKDKAT